MQFAVDLVQAQSVCDWGVNFEGFRRNAPPFAAWHVAHGAHVVGAIGQLDQDDPHVAGHGQQHLAKGLGLVFFAGVELQLFQLGQTVHQLGHRGTKALDQLGFGDAAVFHGVVQQGGRQGLRVELPFGAQRGHRNGVGDVGLAALAHLTQVGLVSKAVGFADHVCVLRAQVVQAGRQSRKAGRRCIGHGGADRFGAVVTGGRSGGQGGAHGINVTEAALFSEGNRRKKAPWLGLLQTRREPGG